MIMTAVGNYSEDSIRTLDWKEHIRRRPGMYIGKLGDGTSPDDGIYILIKEVLDNSIDEYMMGFGKAIDISINEHQVKIRDYGRGVPLGKLVDVASKMNTGAKYDDKVFKKAVGLNGVGIKAVNALLQKAADGDAVRYLDIGVQLLLPDGTLAKTTAFDFLHLTRQGYEIWAEALAPVVSEMLSGGRK